MRRALLNGVVQRLCESHGCNERWPCEKHALAQMSGGQDRTCKQCGYTVCNCRRYIPAVSSTDGREEAVRIASGSYRPDGESALARLGVTPTHHYEWEDWHFLYGYDCAVLHISREFSNEGSLKSLSLVASRAFNDEWNRTRCLIETNYIIPRNLRANFLDETYFDDGLKTAFRLLRKRKLDCAFDENCIAFRTSGDRAIAVEVCLFLR